MFQTGNVLFKSTLVKFIRTYSFVTNIVRLYDTELHKFHAYARFLVMKLPRDNSGKVDLDDEMTLQRYRIQKVFEGQITIDGENALENTKFAGSGKKQDEESPLSELIKLLNERFGTDFAQKDKILEQVVADLGKIDDLRAQAKNNSIERFKCPFNSAFEAWSLIA